jgi:hypothetical protein
MSMMTSCPSTGSTGGLTGVLGYCIGMMYLLTSMSMKGEAIQYLEVPISGCTNTLSDVRTRQLFKEFQGETNFITDAKVIDQ